MSDSTSALLHQAFDLIESDELEKAQEILAPLLEEEADNAALWWVYAHAVSDTAIGQAALERVLELDSQYPGARELKADVLDLQSEDPDIIELEQGASGSAQSASGFDIDDWEDLESVVEADTESSTSRTKFVLLVGLLIILAGGALVISGAVDISELLSGILPSPEPQVIVVSAPTDEPAPTEADDGVATEVATVVTAEPTASTTADDEPESTLSATDVATTVDETEQPVAELTPVATVSLKASPTGPAVTSDIVAFVSLVAGAIDEFTINPAQSSTRATGLGNTLVIQVCAVPGPEFNSRINTVLSAVVAAADDIPEDIEAVAAGLLNCDDPQASLRIIGVALSAIIDFANEEITDRDFQRAWQPLS